MEVNMKNKVLDFLEHFSQASLDNTQDVLEWFVDDDVSQLYTMIMENMGIDEFMEEMSHRVYEYNDKYYILEEEDMLRLQEIEQGE
jgi:hypothetical protein